MRLILARAMPSSPLVPPLAGLPIPISLNSPLTLTWRLKNLLNSPYNLNALATFHKWNIHLKAPMESVIPFVELLKAPVSSLRKVFELVAMASVEVVIFCCLLLYT